MEKAIYIIFFLVVILLLSCKSDQSTGELWKSGTAEYNSEHPDTIIKTRPEQSFRDTVITIYYTNKSLVVKPADIFRLKELADICNSDSLDFVKVVGFTDTTGDEEFNEILSENRANNIYNYLNHNNKIKREQMYVAWLGESKDVYDLHFHPIHPQQNCVDIWLQIKTPTGNTR